MEQLVKHMARDVANIVCEYTTIWKRPFLAKHCMVCGVVHQRMKTNLCTEHAETCSLCLRWFNKNGTHITCHTCRRQLTPAFIDLLYNTNHSKTILEQLYATRDELDQTAVRNCASAMLAERERLVWADHEAVVAVRRWYLPHQPEWGGEKQRTADIEAAKETHLNRCVFSGTALSTFIAMLNRTR